MMRLTAFAIFVLCAHSAQATTYTIVQTQTSTVGVFQRTDSLVRVDGDARQQFHMFKVRRAGAPSIATMVLLPALGLPFSWYELDGDDDYRKSVVGVLASRGVEVWGYSPRWASIPAGACEAGTFDCSVLANWGLQTIADDVSFIRTQIPSNRRVGVGGHSLGGFGALAAANKSPNAWAELLVSDAMLRTNDSTLIARNADLCAAYGAQISGGTVSAALTPVKIAAQLGFGLPNDPSPFPGFPPGTTNRQALVAVLSLPALAAIQNVPAFVTIAGDVPTGTFTYADDALLSRTLLSFYDYAPVAILRDISCALAGATTFTSRLHQFRGDAFFSRSEQGFGAFMDPTINLLSHARAKVQRNFAGQGHSDPWSSATVTEDLVKPFWVFLLASQLLH